MKRLQLVFLTVIACCAFVGDQLATVVSSPAAKPAASKTKKKPVRSKFRNGLISAYEFTYPANGKNFYAASIRSYLAAHPLGRGSANKRALIERHIQLAKANYAKHIAGSKVRIFDRLPIHDRQVFATKLPNINQLPNNAQITKLSAGQSMVMGKINYRANARPYSYQTDHAYVDFANKKIMGGALGRGFVQEEIEMLESNFLPIGARVRASNFKGAKFANRISLKNLDTHPVVLKLRIFAEMMRQHEIYGNKLEGVKPFSASQYLKSRPAPADVYITAMAAKDYHGLRGARYSRPDIENAIKLATKAFFNTMLAQDGAGKPIRIHTGNWGCGAFGNSPRTVWAMQRVAIEAAYSQFQRATGKSPPVDFFYEAFDGTGLNHANHAHNWVAANLSRNMTVAKAAAVIFGQTRASADWQVH